MSGRGMWRDYLSITALTAADGINGVLMPLQLADAGYSATAIGPLVASLPFAMLASRFPVGAVYRPRRARWLLTVSLLIAAACSAVYPFVVSSVPLFVAVRVLHGLSSGAATTVNLALFIDSQPAGQSRARGMGLYSGGMAAGFTVGNIVGGVAGDVLGYGGAFAMSALFWIAGLLQALVTVTPAAPAGAPRQPRPTGAPRPRSLGALLGALRDPAVVSVAMLSFQLNALHQVQQVFFPLIARGVGLGLAEIGLLRALYSLVNAVGRPLSTPITTRLGAGRASFWTFAVQAVIVACIPLGASGGLLAFGLLFALSGSMRAVGITANAIAMAEDIPESRLSRGLASSLFNAAKDIGNITGPLIGSIMVSVVGLQLMFVAGSALLLVLQIAVTRAVAWSARRAASPA